MINRSYETLSQAMNALREKGYKEDFHAEEDGIHATKADKLYQPKELLIVDVFRFEGMTNPSDSEELFAIESNDGIKGSMVMSYGAKHSQNVDLIKAIPMK